MSLKFIQWSLFLLVAFGTLVGLLTSGIQGEPGILLLFIGLSLSLYVFLFVPYCAKFHLSEMMIIVFTLAIEMTLIANTMRNKNIQPWELGACIAGALLVPFILFFVIDYRRPIRERLWNRFVTPPPPQTRQQLRKALIWNCLGLVVWIIIPLVNILEGRSNFHPIYILLGVGWVLQAFGTFSNWNAYKKTGDTNAAGPIAPDENPPN